MRKQRHRWQGGPNTRSLGIPANLLDSRGRRLAPAVRRMCSHAPPSRRSEVVAGAQCWCRRPAGKSRECALCKTESRLRPRASRWAARQRRARWRRDDTTEGPLSKPANFQSGIPAPRQTHLMDIEATRTGGRQVCCMVRHCCMLPPALAVQETLARGRWIVIVLSQQLCAIHSIHPLQSDSNLTGLGGQEQAPAPSPSDPRSRRIARLLSATKRSVHRSSETRLA